MVSHFHGCNNILVTMTMTSMFIFCLSFFLLAGSPAAAAGRENPLVEMSSREELAQMAGYGEEKLSTVVISGTVLCDEACNDEKAQTNIPHPVSGALVAVSCHTRGKTSKSNWVEVTTDEYGDFLIDLPSHLHAIPNMDKRCVVKVLQLPKNSLCHHPSFTGKQAGLKLSSVGSGIRAYTAESLHLTPKPSQGCTNKGDGEEKGTLRKAY